MYVISIVSVNFKCVTVLLSAEQTEKPVRKADTEDLPDVLKDERLSYPESAEHLDKFHDKPSDGRSAILKWILTFGGGAASGYAAGKYRKEIMGLLKTVLSMF